MSETTANTNNKPKLKPKQIIVHVSNVSREREKSTKREHSTRTSHKNICCTKMYKCSESMRTKIYIWYLSFFVLFFYLCLKIT